MSYGPNMKQRVYHHIQQAVALTGLLQDEDIHEVFEELMRTSYRECETQDQYSLRYCAIALRWQTDEEIDKDSRRQELIELARDQYCADSDDGIEVDDDARVAWSENGNWVQAWVWVQDDDSAS